jgi:hypothetical protein
VTGDCHAGILWEPGGAIPPGDPTLTGKISNWKHALNILTIHYGDRLTATQ